ncbi:MAG: deoxyribodipyrimidine photo-lyase, partial [Pseudomonadota bacterium]
MPNSHPSPAGQAPVIVWFRRDLRLKDNPAMGAAIASGRPIICTYIYDDVDARRPLGGASNWWLDKSLRSLAADIKALGGRLVLRRGAPDNILDDLIAETGAAHLVWNRRYGAPEQALDKRIKASLTARGIKVESFNGSLLVEPWVLKTGSGSYYRVFSPFWRALQARYRTPMPAPRPTRLAGSDVPSAPLDDWGLHPSQPDWSTGFDGEWQPGEAGAQSRLLRFLDENFSGYSDDRNRPDKP